tara:strand:- start:16 stop:774 length:759 start_codon:yes stop_codon:yes gene_type:complete
MQYFQDFQNLLYTFGDEVDPVIFQDISRYSDVVDQIKDNLVFHNVFTIQEGFRPDQVSIILYGSPLYYWTFYVLNDDLREQGWPLTKPELDVYVKKSFPNTVLVTRDNIATKFKVGQVVTGVSSGVSGTIIRRNLNLGQIVIKGDVLFSANGEQLQSTNSSGTIETVTSISRVKEYLSASHYEDSSGIVDLGIDSDTTSATFGGLLPAGAQQTEKTFEDVFYSTNESLRQIKVIKPSLLGSVISSYKKAIRE